MKARLLAATIRMRTGEVFFMVENKNFIKILDYETALRLSESGFSYIIEKFNGTQELYCFIDCEEIRAELLNMEFSAEDKAYYIEEETLSF